MTEPQPLKVLIADDEPLAVERLQLLLARTDGAQLVGTLQIARTALGVGHSVPFPAMS